MIIKKAEKKDIGTIKILAETVWPETYKDILSPDQVDYMMDLFYSRDSLAKQFIKHTFIIAYVNDKPVGFASYSLSEKPGIYKLHKIYVNTNVQGQGIGKVLVQFIVTELSPQAAVALELNVNRDNKARLFYEKLGFKLIREEDIDIGQGHWMNDYVMRKDF